MQIALLAATAGDTSAKHQSINTTPTSNQKKDKTNANTSSTQAIGSNDMSSKLKRGATRDGLIFWRYIKDYEYWVTPFVFEHLKKKEIAYRAKYNAKRD
jgi:hypothetical protein